MQNNNKKAVTQIRIWSNMGYNKDLFWVPYFFIIYKQFAIGDLQNIPHWLLYADDTSRIVTGSNPVQFLTEISTTFDDIVGSRTAHTESSW
jgi:hypothetical protein